jgi:PPOX class probable F420-dependent enzyme
MESFGLAHRLSRRQDRLLDRLRDHRAAEAADLPGTADTFETLIDEQYALVVTFRRLGEPVPTPVWFGLHRGLLYVESLADAGKVRRLRHDPHVRVAPCTIRGRRTGPFTEGVGRILAAAEEKAAEAALDRHYGLRRRLYVGLGTRLGVKTVFLELTPTPGRRAPG